MAKAAKEITEATSLAPTIYIIGGGKGGIGKSLIATNNGDRLANMGIAPSLLVFDGDITNPDVQRRFESTGAMRGIGDLRLADEWRAALGTFEESKAAYINVNLPATAAIGARAKSLRMVADELGHKVVTIFLMTKSPDCLELLSNDFDSGAISVSDKFLIIINEVAGRASDFRKWHDSDIKKKVMSDPRCAGVYALPELFYGAVDVLDAAPQHTPSQIIGSGQLTIITRVEFKQWIDDLWSNLAKTDTYTTGATAFAAVEA